MANPKQNAAPVLKSQEEFKSVIICATDTNNKMLALKSEYDILNQHYKDLLKIIEEQLVLRNMEKVNCPENQGDFVTTCKPGKAHGMNKDYLAEQIEKRFGRFISASTSAEKVVSEIYEDIPSADKRSTKRVLDPKDARRKTGKRKAPPTTLQPSDAASTISTTTASTDAAAAVTEPSAKAARRDAITVSNDPTATQNQRKNK